MTRDRVEENPRAVLDNIASLVPGDRIYVQTREGYYVYVFRNSQIVLPSQADVLLPAPARQGALHRCMHSWLVRHLPGPLWLRIATSLVLAGGALVLMVQFLFPWLAQFIQLTDSTIGSARHP